MEKYKPGYLGKVMPVDNPSKLTDFVTNKYDAFSKIYDTVKNQSENISDVNTIESTDGSKSLSVKVTASTEALNDIKENAKNDESIVVKDSVITANS